MPAPGRVLRWPASFGRRFLVSVDVEEEFDWSLPLATGPRSVTNVAALPPWHDAMRQRGIAPLYLADYPVASDRAAASLLREIAATGGAIGAQLHPWATPPQAEAGDEAASFAGNLAPALEAAKLDRLIAAIEENVGVRPVAYRAGRYGIGPRTAHMLQQRGLRLDVSVRSRFDYSAIGGPNFREIGPDAFHLSDALLEVPLSTIDIGALRTRAPSLERWSRRLPRSRGVLARSRLWSRVPLTPEGVGAGEAERAIATAARDGTRLLQLAFHSPSLVPGNTPYVRTAADLVRLHRWWDRVIAALGRHGYAPVSAPELIAAAR